MRLPFRESSGTDRRSLGIRRDATRRRATNRSSGCGRNRKFNLFAIHGVLISVNECPECIFLAWKFAREDAVFERRGLRFPPRTHEQVRKCALNLHDWTKRLTLAECETVMDTDRSRNFSVCRRPISESFSPSTGR